MGEFKYPIITNYLHVHSLIKFINSNWSNKEIFITESCCLNRHNIKKLYNLYNFNKYNNVTALSIYDLTYSCILNNTAYFLKKIYLPDLITDIDTYVISFAPLKMHRLVNYTGVIKNMVGILPRKIYQWGKNINNVGLIHKDLDNSIIDLYNSIHINYSFLDGSIGFCREHINGRPCDPPINKKIAGNSAVAVDMYGASLLNLSINDIKYLKVLSKNIKYKIINI